MFEFIKIINIFTTDIETIEQAVCKRKGEGKETARFSGMNGSISKEKQNKKLVLHKFCVDILKCDHFDRKDFF